MKAEKRGSQHAVEGGGREHEVVGTHSARCKRLKHEDWQHGLEKCAAPLGPDRIACDCTAHWQEVRP